MINIMDRLLFGFLRFLNPIINSKKDTQKYTI